MTEGNDEKKKSLLKHDDALLWQYMTEDVQPLPDATYQEDIESPEEVLESEQQPSEKIQSEAFPTKEKSKTKAQGKEIDRRTAERLRKGQIPIEARLDLHGYRQHQAKDALEPFIKAAYASGKRCVLVITGKGNFSPKSDHCETPMPGVLKQKVPLWLSEGALGEIVLQFCPSQPKDGGSGALYVYLRRHR